VFTIAKLLSRIFKDAPSPATNRALVPLCAKQNLVLSMKKICILATTVLFYCSSIAQPTSPMKMHRLQDKTKNSNGLYYGKSTEGHFSVLLPVPFNDFTVKRGDVTTYVIGSKTEVGIKFSATKLVKDKNKTTNFDELVKSFASAENTITKVKKERIKSNDAVSFIVTDKSNGAMFKYIDTKNSLFIITIEFPIGYKKTVENKYGYFFTSLTISAP
jgi:hypothetical protein